MAAPMGYALVQLKNRVLGPAALLAEGALGLVHVPAPRRLLILGHMRSGSSLLLHLLITHPEVGAVGERNRAYRGRGDLARLALATRFAARPWRRPLAYVVDQVNHSQFTPCPALLADARVRLVFLLREPQSSVASLLELSRRFYADAWTPERAVAYYLERLGSLARLAALTRPGNAAFIEYETLTRTPEILLTRLAAFLGLAGGFSTTYARHAFTGVRGDPGARIAAGRVLPAQPTAPGALAPAQRAALARAYQGCRNALTPLALTAEGA